MKNVIATLKERGFIDNMTSEELEDLVEKPLLLYAGFDPTSDSLHLGNLIGIMGLAWFQKFGHTPIAIVGGATGMVGDPSGRSVERNLLDQKIIESNLKGIRRSLEAVLKNEITILNNYDWFKEIRFIDFLRDTGKYFRLGGMLAKESVKVRAESEEGLSYTEFSYQLLQAYDFLHLYDTFHVICQIGGSDQWGNITAGTELIRKKRQATVYGLTFPLLTRSDGKKFGKSEQGAIWLNSDKLSPFDFYQYLVRMPDSDLPKLLRMLTFLEMGEIVEIENSMKRPSYLPNTAQKRLAEEVTRLVHGEEGLKEALAVTEAAKPGGKTELNAATLEALLALHPRALCPMQAVIGKRVLDLLVTFGLLASKGEGKRIMATGGGIYLNNEKIADEHLVVTPEQLVEGSYLLLGVGKKKKIVIRIE
jgi:tyrosyl-tRNA synthetase